jgi:hypothetical protein
MVYIVLVPYTDPDFIPVPFTRREDYAYGYVKTHLLKKECVVPLEDEEFERYTIESPYYAFEIDRFKDSYLIWEEFEEVSDAMDDMAYSTITSIQSLAEDLKYFKGKDVEEVRLAIQKLMKNLKKEGDQGNSPENEISLAMYSRLKKSKFIKEYFKNVAIETYEAADLDEEGLI